MIENPLRIFTANHRKNFRDPDQKYITFLGSEMLRYTHSLQGKGTIRTGIYKKS